MEKELCFSEADILLPKKNPERFSVIACDQFTSEPEYWNGVSEWTKGFNTALDLILPEIYLKEDNSEEIKRINGNMQRYMSEDVFKKNENCFVFTKRTQSDGLLRLGLIGKIDLKEYSYKDGSAAAVRSTEKTVLERIPPRAQIRKGASIELPHIMLLFDDKKDSLMSFLSGREDEFEKLYGFDLYGGAGHIEGFKTDTAANKRVKELLKEIEKENGGLLFCVGDGNHSLAAAKSIYEKSGLEKDRYALVEIVNIHSPAINFEPIYRVCFGVDPEKLISDFEGCTLKDGEFEHTYNCVFAGGEKTVRIKSDYRLPVAALQNFLDNIKGGVRTDYIHGVRSAGTVACAESGRVAFIFDGMKKTDLFGAVIKNGSLPRKTFSMGHALDKRFYLEAREL